MSDTLCLYTTVKNISGAAQTFSFLPVHGKQMAAGDDYTFFGSIQDRLMTGGGRLNLRKSAALEAALLAGQIEIITSPKTSYYDASFGRVKSMNINNNAVTIIDPCFGAYTGPS